MSISELTTYSTVIIETFCEEGGTGTGFFFDFNDADLGNTDKLIIVTNWHVIENSSTGQLVFTKIDKAGKPIDTEHLTIVLDNFESLWIPHPNPEVDLAILPIKSILHQIPENFYFGAFDRSHIPTKEGLENLCAIEEVTMIGYPNGIWDERNNKPLIRKGITATNPRLDYCGEKEFLIDIACFLGSSGSPVLIYNVGQYLDGADNHYFVSYRIVLLGILYSARYYTSEGKIKVVKIPAKKKQISMTEIPLNLGTVIRAERILDFEKHI